MFCKIIICYPIGWTLAPFFISLFFIFTSISLTSSWCIMIRGSAITINGIKAITKEEKTQRPAGSVLARIIEKEKDNSILGVCRAKTAKKRRKKSDCSFPSLILYFLVSNYSGIKHNCILDFIHLFSFQIQESVKDYRHNSSWCQ